jgi:predicted nucleotidyltransferase
MPEAVPLICTPPSADDPMLAEVVRRLQELYHPEQIYLFGSTARGEAGPDSDYDLMVVVPDSTPVSLRDSGRAYKAIWRLGMATDVLVWTRSDFEERLPLKASLPSTIAREGKLLLCSLKPGAERTHWPGSKGAQGFVVRADRLSR